ncbi:hypothetical protein MGWOODY_Tha2317 [hydrothermal vent metagenome]|uniref:Uncharacterized protein n=1 Tax=hydrothermal vent metagenome TaxID=652676 RepID=A0A160TCW2_9ZZZZ
MGALATAGQPLAFTTKPLGVPGHVSKKLLTPSESLSVFTALTTD